MPAIPFRSLVHGFHLIPRNEIDSIHLPRSSTTAWRESDEAAGGDEIKRVDLGQMLHGMKWMVKEAKRFIHYLHQMHRCKLNHRHTYPVAMRIANVHL